MAFFSLLSAAWLAFKIWMVVDAIRRGAAYYWFFIIFFLPFGELVYFAMVKADDFRLPKLEGLFQRPPSISDLRFRFQNTPSLDNQLALAQALLQSGQWDEAGKLFEDILSSHTDSLEATFGLAKSRLAAKDYGQALPMLAGLVASDPGHQDYAGWLALARGQRDSGQRTEGLDSMRRLVAKSPRLAHKYQLAQYLVEDGQTAEARGLLEEAILEHRQAPAYIKRQNRLLVIKIKRFLAGLGRI